jgi:pyochelin biosynthetic protein PchC
MSSRSPWLVALRSEAAATRRLVCFPHAGGGTLFFHSWVKHVGPDVELLAVGYPGRESRFEDPLVGSVAEAARAVADALLAEPARETVLFGHSMGASIAYETLRLLEADGRSDVTRLCVSARRATGFPEPMRTTPRDDDELLSSMRQLGGTHPELLENASFREMLFPIIRNDYLLVDTYRPDPDAKLLDVDVQVVIGADDPRVKPEEAAAWEGVTRGSFDMWTMTGGHFYLTEHVADVVSLALTGELAEAGGGQRSRSLRTP